jgi:hypothetical protein
LKTLPKAAGAAERRSTQHYWTLNIILLMLRATLIIELKQSTQALGFGDGPRVAPEAFIREGDDII